MIWLTWRQHRAAILTTIIGLACISLILLITGLNINAEASRLGIAHCTQPVNACIDAQMKLQDYINKLFNNATFYNSFLVLLLIVPLLIGMFVGPRLLAGEFEQGTYRFIWTQGKTRYQWFLSKTFLLLLLILLPFLLMSILVWWWHQPIQLAVDSLWTLFDLWGIVSLAYLLFAITLSIAAGTVTKKTVPAMAITLVLFILIRVLIEFFWRPYFLTPVSLAYPVGQTPNISAQALVLQQNMIDRQGHILSNQQKASCMTTSKIGSGINTIIIEQEDTTCMKLHGFQSRTIYQPPERFWTFQWIEFGIYMALSSILMLFTLWWMRQKILA